MDTFTEIDRIAPTRRPDRKPDGWQKWRSLLFMHWSIPVEALRPIVPPELELDLYQGQAYIGIVPFEMLDVRSWWMPQRIALNFLETNLRTYVVHKGRPGVYFVSLEAASPLAVWAAKRIWSLPYFHAAISMREEEGIVHYQSKRTQPTGDHSVRYRVGDALPVSQPGTLEHFFLERYLLFLTQGRNTLVGQVYHTPYPAHTAEVLEVEDSLATAAGLPQLQGLPELAHYSPGVDVEIFGLQPIA